MNTALFDKMTKEEDAEVATWSETRVRFEWDVWRNSGVQLFMDGVKEALPVETMRTVISGHRTLTRYVEEKSHV
ncbi:MAG: hypothetical protein EOP09_07940 [Proteobacteria bacterium]|nr:MAG: hypothetical protein EOP09_07940 [Pseudomonadota bacterium]